MPLKFYPLCCKKNLIIRQFELIVPMSLLLLCGAYGQVQPQPLANQKSNVGWSDEIVSRYKNQHEDALSLAKQRNWFIIKNYAKGKILSLQGVDSFGEAVYYTTHNVEASDGTRTDALYKGGTLGLALTGNSAFLSGKLGLWDGGRALPTHAEFGGRLKQMDKATNIIDHATHLAGTIMGAGANANAKGMAYGMTQLKVWDFTNDVVEMAENAQNLLVSNHAYGPTSGWILNPSRPGSNNDQKWEWWGSTNISPNEDYKFGFYDEKARDFDRIAFNNPFYLIVKSADNKRGETGPPPGTVHFLRNTNVTSTAVRSRNDAYDVIPADANAKNILTVGSGEFSAGSSGIGRTAANIRVAPYSGWGPTDDGRIKPDILGFGTGVLSSLSTGNTAYGSLSGTSMASANVSGSLLLLQELHYGLKKTFMRAATLKGLVIHTADKPAGRTEPSYQYGWGMLNAEKAAKVLMNSDFTHLLFEKTILDGGVFTQKIIASGTDPITVTLSWTDPEGAPLTVDARNLDNPTPRLIHDLDLRLDDGNVQWTPWILDPANPDKVAVNGDNRLDNVEQIFITRPVPGKVYTLTVRHKGKLQTSGQPYSLLISGLQRQDCRAATVFANKISSDTLLCGSAKIEMAISGGDVMTYEWLRNDAVVPNSNSNAFSTSQAGVYSVRATGYSCSEVSRAITVRVSDLRAAVSPGGLHSVCDGDKFRLNATTGTTYKYQWQLDDKNIAGATAPVLDATRTGNYNVIITNDGCAVTSASARIVAVKVPADIIVDNPKDGTVKLAANPGNGYKYQWFLDGKALALATFSKITVSKPGTYTVQVQQGLCRTTSKPVLLVLSNELIATKENFGINLKPESSVLVNEQFMRMYPNPAAEMIRVAYEGPTESELTATVYDLLGQPRQSVALEIDADTRLLVAQFDVSLLPVGHYFVRIFDGRAYISKHFFKK